MSLKSFDKFCKKPITGRPDSEREYFDERQKVIRLQIGVEALLIFAFASFFNSMIMDYAYQWAESGTVVMFLIVMICAMYYIIKTSAKGSFFGVNGRFVRKLTIKLTIIMPLLASVLNLIRVMFDLVSEGSIVINGMLSNNFLFAVSFTLLAINGVIVLINLYKKD